MMLPMPIHSTIKARLVIGHLLSESDPSGPPNDYVHLPGRLQATRCFEKPCCRPSQVQDTDEGSGPSFRPEASSCGTCRRPPHPTSASICTQGRCTCASSTPEVAYGCPAIALPGRGPSSTRSRLPPRPRRRLRVRALRVRCVRWGPDRGQPVAWRGRRSRPFDPKTKPATKESSHVIADRHRGGAGGRERESGSRSGDRSHECARPKPATQSS